MTYGVAITSQAPVELYDQLHKELLRTTGSRVEGLLLHFGRPVEGGFQVVEIWDSREQSDHYNRHVVGPLMTQVFQDHPSFGEPVTEEFEVRGLLIPDGGIGY